VLVVCALAAWPNTSKLARMLVAAASNLKLRISLLEELNLC